MLGTVATMALLLAAGTLLPPPPTKTMPAPIAVEAALVELPAAPAPAQPSPPDRPAAMPLAPPHAMPRPAFKPRPSAPTHPPAERPRPAAPSPAPVEAAQPQELPGGSGAARAIYQPAPLIPPELRRHALAVVAQVRFTVATDGSATVELAEATADPRLNQILLDGFRRWRFFPALRDGQPVASVLVLRVPISVE